MNSKDTIKGSLILFLTAFIWGVAFVFQKVGMEHIGPFFFVFLRFLLGSLTVFVILMLFRLFRKSSKEPIFTKNIIIGGLIVGIILGSASCMQQFSITVVTASKTSFLTALYIVLVPILGIFLKQKTRWNVWVSVVLAMIGIYCLSIKSDFSIEPLDLLLLVSSLFWACHILVTDWRIKGLTNIQILSFCTIQFAVASVIGLVLMFIFEFNTMLTSFDQTNFIDMIPSVLFVGVLSSGVAFYTQSVGQKFAPPSVAALIMSLEAVVGALTAVIYLGERMTIKETVGCVLMFIAIIIVELPIGKSKDDLADKLKYKEV